MSKSKCVFRNSFYLQHVILGLLFVLQVSLRVRRRNGDMRKLRKAVRVVGRARDCIRCSLAKAMLPLEEMNFGVTVSFVRLVERRALSPLKWPRGELRARCRERNKGIASTFLANFGGDIKLFLWWRIECI